MGAKDPDRVVSPPSPMTAPTLAEMHVRRWELRADCNRCKVQLRVSLPAMIRAQGPDAIWWGQHPTCPGYECPGGKLTYYARAISSGSWVSMTSVPDERTIAFWRSSRRARGRARGRVR
ncbi:hypothetical protein [Phenylobacterium immobile]|uniref:hypothetical protein n=1 Tax=Phenylobacterium immobile TaxID=21 RepID=UPI000A891DA6|nr:hypothetical protein [Phenylobacterium immobile]